MKNLLVNDLTVRDGNQSLMATRMPKEDILKLVSELDKVGFNALEVWGGATFDVCLRYLNEDPWERLRDIRKAAPNTKLQMLLRGQNLVGYTHYADDVVDKFVEKAVTNGIDIIRVFDALNDLRNVEAAVKAIKKHKGHCQMAISYTTSPVHSIDYFIQLATEMEKMGADSICIKDMAGILVPEDAYQLITGIKKVVQVPLALHTHATAGIALLTIERAIAAGIDIIDGCISPFSQGTSHPAIESYISLAKMHGREVAFTEETLESVFSLATDLANQYIDQGSINAKAYQINPKILQYQVPGGMLTNLMSQLKDQGAFHLYEDVLKEIPKVREELGYPPLVTPLSQMVGTQAVMNVMSKESYKMISKEVKEYVRGNYGKAPAKIKQEIIDKVVTDGKIIDCRPADLLAPSFEKSKQELKDKWNQEVCEEDVLSFILFPQFIGETKNKVEAGNSKQTEVEHFEIYYKEENA